MPTNKKTGTTPVNTRKTCPICGKSKVIKNGFYKTSSPMFEDGCVPICITCVKHSVLNEDGTIDKKKLKIMCQRLDRPLYWDDLNSAYNQARTEHGYLSDDEVAKMGEKIVGYYFKNINSLRQTKNKSFADSEKDNFIHSNSNTTVAEKDRIKKEYVTDEKATTIPDEEPIILNRSNNFEVTEDMINLFGEGYTKTEYKKMARKYEEMKQTYVIQTSIHREALVTYVRFKVKEEIATAKGDVVEAQKWYAAAQTAAEQGKLTAKQLSKEDLQGGIVNFSDIFTAVEGAKERIKIFPEFKYQPKDAADFIIWCYINYERNLNNMPEIEYKEIYKFYDKKKKEYVDTYGDPYGIFSDDTTEENRETIEKFITIPKEFKDGE